MILDIAAKRAQLTPDRTALWFEGSSYSYADLNERAGLLAGRLADAGIGKGDRVAILGFNHLAHIDLILATAKLGFIYTPFNHRLSEREQEQLGSYTRPALLLYDQENATKAQAAAKAGIPLRNLDEYEQWLRGSSGPPTTPDLTEEDIQMILFTGGTTGVPKGAMLPYRQGYVNACNTVLSWGLRDDDCVIQATPCFHAAVNAFTLPLLHLGAQVVLQRTFDPGEYLELVERHRATILFLVPTMYAMLEHHQRFTDADLSSVRWAISGGAPCPAPLREGFAGRGIDFKQGYGLTEAGVNCFAIDLSHARQKPDSVGHPVMFARAQLRNPDGSAVENGEVGELTLAGPHVFSGYFERPQETAQVLRDGWLWTGDLARQDEDGFYYLVGRRKELFISGGENVFPAEIENALYKHSLVSECAVVGVPDTQWGEVGLAAVVLAPGASKGDAGEELRGFLRTQLAGYKVPKRFLFLPELPKSGAGKVLRRELAQLAQEES